jgi:hypothetical protein
MAKNKLVSALVVVAIVVGLGAFYGGYVYGQAKAVSQRQMTRGQFGQAGPDGQRVQGANRMQGGGAGFGTGEVISKDDKSVTIKLRDGGSKIVFISADTEVSKFTSGAIVDLEVGKTIMVNGKTNEDGSITAQTIQVRPPMPSQLPVPPAK